MSSVISRWWIALQPQLVSLWIYKKSRWVLEIVPTPCWVSKFIIMVIKNQIPDFNIHNYSYQKILCPFSIFLKNSNIQLKLFGLCEFFHETQWFFEVFEIPQISGSLTLNLFKHPEPSGITKFKYPQCVLQNFCSKSTLKRFFFFQNVLPLSVKITKNPIIAHFRTGFKVFSSYQIISCSNLVNSTYAM
jgi:hypothetical protein